MIISTLSDWFTTQLASMPWAMLALLFVLALFFSAVGFYRVVYFISIGYAFSIVAMAVTVMILLFRDLTWASALHNVLLIIWGLRLGIYLLRRELQSSYGKAMADVHQRTAKMPFSRRARIWVGVSFLYVAMFSPSLFSLSSSRSPPFSSRTKSCSSSFHPEKPATPPSRRISAALEAESRLSIFSL